MTEADQARKFAELKLGEGNVAAAIRFSRQYLQFKGAAAPVVVYPLLEPFDASGLALPASVREVGYHEDSDTAATARLLPGMPQIAHWASPYVPPALRVLALQRCVALCPNLLLTAAGQLLNDNIGYTNAELCAHLPPEFPGVVASDLQIIVAVRHRETARVNEPAFYLPATTNYAAWFFGSLPRLAAYAGLGELPIVLHGDASAYQLASLVAMGVRTDRVIQHAAHVRLECRQLYYCTTSYYHHAPSVTGLNHIRACMKDLLNEPARPDAKRLYLARRNARDRPLLNEAEVIQLFESHGFIAIDPENYTFDEQVRYAASAEIIAGPYGANLANLIFAQRARRCLVLATKQQPEFARLASALGIACWHTVPEAIKLREGRTVSESYGFTANLQYIETALQACMAESSAAR